MPLYNNIGDPLPRAILTPQASQKIANLSKLQYPDDKERIFHLSPDDFRIWLYLLNPRDSLLLCSTYGISQKIQHQMKRKRWSLVSDWLWRLCH